MGGAAATSVAVVAGVGGYAVMQKEGQEPPVDHDDDEEPALLIEEYPKTKIATIDNVGTEPLDFSYPLEDHENFLVKLGEPARGGVGPDNDIVAFNYTCTHMGCPMTDTYDAETSSLGPCGCHMTRFDLTNHGQVIMGHATQDLPQILLSVEDGDIYALGVTGLIYGFSNNFGGSDPSPAVRDALREGDMA